MRKTLENQLFTWEDWDSIDDHMNLQFYNVTLLVPIGEYPAGHKFAIAYILGDESVVQFDLDNDQSVAYELNVSIGNKIVGPVDSNMIEYLKLEATSNISQA